MPVFRVPIAIDDQEQLFRPETAEKNKAYYCFACREPVVFKKGEVKVAHFAHKVSDTCNQETYTHRAAKLLVQMAVQNWKAGKAQAPSLQRNCQICRKTTVQPLPDKVDKAILEYPLTDGSVADVALIVNGVAEASIEIRVTHAVDEAKANRISVRFIELDGFEVVENPSVWKPITDRFIPITCARCKENYSQFRTKIKRIASECKLELPETYYRSGLCKCWKCNRQIVAFTWPNHEMWDGSAPEVKPVPITVQYRSVKGIPGKCLVNTCPYCHSMQGDFYLYCEPDGPFFSVRCEVDSATAFERDMMRIALNAAENGLL